MRNPLRGPWLKLQALIHPRQAEQQLDDELHFHLEQEAALLRARGVEPAEATRIARARLGGLDHTREAVRDGRGDRLLGDLARDLRYGLRVLRRQSTLTLTVVTILGLGIGATVAILSAVNAVLLRPLPFPEPDRLVALWENNDLKGWKGETAAPANVLDWQEQVRAFQGVGGWLPFDDSPILAIDGEPRAIRATAVTGDFFPVLGVRALHGRAFEPADTWRTAPPSVVLSHRVWQERFNGDPAVVGRTVTLDASPVQVVGIMGPDFAFPSREVDAWLPVRWDPADRAQTWFRRAHFVRPFARLREGTTPNAARIELQQVMRTLQQRYPDTNTAMEADLGSLQGFLVGGSRTPLLLLLGATGLLLLIACANVGNLLLVRATTREREVVMRRALGAARWRIVRQALTESGLLGLAGGGVGLVVGWWGTRVLTSLQPAGLLPVTDIHPDARVAGVVLLVCFLCAALFGTVPALWAAKRPAADALRESGRSTSISRRMQRVITSLVTAEVAIGAVLTLGAALLLRSYQALTRVDPGFDPRGVVAVSFSLPGARYDTSDKIAVFYDALLERARAIPGVSHAAVTTVLPLTGGGYTGYTTDFSIRGRGSDGTGREVRHRQVSPDYFTTLRVPLVKGRGFELTDVRSAEPVVLINQVMAERFFRGRDPIGEYIASDLVPDSTSVWRRVIGVVGNEHGRSLRVSPGLDMIHPIYQDRASGAHLLVRTTTSPTAVFRTLEGTITAVDPMLAPTRTLTLDTLRERALSTDRFMAVLCSAFAGVGCLLAIVGIYGVVAQSTLQRLPEMAIRQALGAQAGSLRWLIVRRGLALTAVGLTAGLVLSAVLQGTMKGLLFSVSPLDPLSLVLVVALIVGTGAVAAWLPARRLADPQTLGRSLR